MNCNVHVKNVDKTRFGHIFGTSDMKAFRIAFFSIVFLSSIFFIGIVNARGGTFIVEPSEKTNERVKLGARDTVRGNFSVSNGFIDFYIMSPSGTVFLRYNKTAFDIFNFTAEEDGNYTMHLVNTYQAENVSVTLNYSVHFVITLQGEVDVGYSVGTATVIEVPLPIEYPDPEFDDDLYRKYLSFLRAHQILRIVRNVRKYVPFQSSLLVAFICIALVTALREIVKLVHRRSFPASLMS